MASKPHHTYSLSYQERASLRHSPPLTSYLLRLMAAKQTNLCLSADVQSTSQLLDIAEECGNSICILKTHADIIHDFGEKTMKGLMEIASRKKFLLFEDRKFGDIGNTVQTQYAAGTHRIASWASLVNAHIFPGPGIVTSLKSAAMSSLASNNSRISTEIIGGAPLPDDDTATGYFLSKTASRTSSSKKSSAISSDDDDAETATADDEDDDQHESTPSADSFWGDKKPFGQDGRKGSVVSVSTTISSSTEYISPPAASPAESPADFNGIPVQAPLARGLLLLAQMSSKDHMLGPYYTQKCVEIARDHSDFVVGFIAQEMLNFAPEDNFLVMTPGISLPPESSHSSPSSTPGGVTGLQQRAKAAAAAAASSSSPSSSYNNPVSSKQQSSDESFKTDGKDQLYNTPRHAIAKGSDVIIVGRGIISAEDRAQAAERYRIEGWTAYLHRIGGTAGSNRSKKSTGTNLKAAVGEKVTGLLPIRGRPG